MSAYGPLHLPEHETFKASPAWRTPEPKTPTVLAAKLIRTSKKAKAKGEKQTEFLKLRKGTEARLGKLPRLPVSPSVAKYMPALIALSDK